VNVDPEVRAAGVETTLRRFSGHTLGSAVLWQSWPPARPWMNDAVAALRRALHEDASPETPAAKEAQ
jgi:hypothetical protein